MLKKCVKHVQIICKPTCKICDIFSTAHTTFTKPSRQTMENSHFSTFFSQSAHNFFTTKITNFISITAAFSTLSTTPITMTTILFNKKERNT